MRSEETRIEESVPNGGSGEEKKGKTEEKVKGLCEDHVLERKE